MVCRPPVLNTCHSVANRLTRFRYPPRRVSSTDWLQSGTRVIDETAPHKAKQQSFFPKIRTPVVAFFTKYHTLQAPQIRETTRVRTREMPRKLLATLITATCCLSGGHAFSANSIADRPAAPLHRLDLDIIDDSLDFEVVHYPAEDVGSLEREQPSTDADIAENKPSPLPPVIQQIADERREFQLNLGKAMDTLKKDMPEILRRQPGTPACIHGERLWDCPRRNPIIIRENSVPPRQGFL